MTMVAFSLVLLFAAYIIKNYVWKLIKTQHRGTEKDATVSRIEKVEMRATGSGLSGNFRWFYCYATYLTEDGLQIETRLLNPKMYLTPGSRIRIRVLDEITDCSVLTDILPDGQT